VDGDALLPQPPDRGRVVVHAVDEDRARALEVAGEQDRGPGLGDPQAGHGGPHGTDLPGQLRAQGFGITLGLGVDVGRGDVDVIERAEHGSPQPDAGASEVAADGRDVTAGARVGMSSPATAQQARNRADMANVWVNPVRVGRPCTVLAATNVAAIWPPSAPPRVRSTVFIPLATPVCWGGTAWTITLPSAADARPNPTPSTLKLSSMSYGA